MIDRQSDRECAARHCRAALISFTHKCLLNNEDKIMELNENLRTPLSRSCNVEASVASFFVVFSAIGDYSCRRPYPVSPSRFPESITRRSCNIFVTGDIVATDTNKAQTDGRTDGQTNGQTGTVLYF